jgi:hypothetical protein
VIQVEPAQIVLIGFALAAVLADDHARHRLQHFAWPLHRTRLELRGGDRPLTGRPGDADEIAGRVRNIGDVAECRRTRHDHVGIQGERQHDVGYDRPRRRHRDRAPDDAEIQEPVGELGIAGGHGVEPVRSGDVGHRRQFDPPRDQLDRDARQRPAGLIHDTTGDATSVLPGGHSGNQQDHCQDECDARCHDLHVHECATETPASRLRRRLRRGSAKRAPRAEAAAGPSRQRSKRSYRRTVTIPLRGGIERTEGAAPAPSIRSGLTEAERRYR